MQKKFVGLAVLAFGAVLLVPSHAEKTKARQINGKHIFEQHCSSCHAGGGNSVKPHRPIAGSKQLATLATFKGYLSAPPGHMPYYEDIVSDAATLHALYDYCKS